MKKFAILILTLFCACTSKLMTLDNYSDVPIGMSTKELKKEVGSPYSIKKLSSGEEEYEYIERINIDGRIVEERHYFITIKDGKITAKRMEKLKKPFFYQHQSSYEMQTSFRSEDS